MTADGIDEEKDKRTKGSYMINYPNEKFLLNLLGKILHNYNNQITFAFAFNKMLL